MMKKRWLLLLTFVAALMLAACQSSTLPSSPTSTTEFALVTATLAPSATATLAPTATAEQVFPTPIVIQQPTSVVPTELAADMLDQKFPIAQLNLYRPGPDSRLVSPIEISAYVYPGAQGKISLQLWDEAGNLTADQLIQFKDSGWVAFSSQIPFEVKAAGESALLTLTSFDDSGRRIALTSVPLLLLQLGESQVEVPGFAKNPFVLRQPAASTTVSGNPLHLEGYLHSFSTLPVIIEVINNNGAMVCSKQIGVPGVSSGDEYSSFSLDLPCLVSENTPVRISLRQTMDRLPYLDLALSSVLVTLTP
jgi:hypothetical protein